MSNNPILKGMTRGAQIVVTRKVERRSFTPATAVQLPTKAWEMVGADHKAENLSMLITSVAFSFLPWMAFGAAIVCAAFGNNVGTFIGSIVGVFSAGPQLIDAVKRKRK